MLSELRCIMAHETSSPQIDPPGWSDAQVDSLLTWFFAQELPPALRDPADNSVPAPRLITVASRGPVRPASRAGQWILTLCAAALAGCVWLLASLPSQQSPMAVRVPATPQLASGTPLRTWGEAELEEVELETVSLPWMVETVSYPGVQGEFAQQSELRWTSESYYEPQAGVWIEWSAPELVIEVEQIAEAGSAEPPL